MMKKKKVFVVAGARPNFMKIRENTERPVTVDVGSNIIVGTDSGLLKEESRKALSGQWKLCAIPDLWDGRAGERIRNILEENYGG